MLLFCKEVAKKLLGGLGQCEIMGLMRVREHSQSVVALRRKQGSREQAKRRRQNGKRGGAV